MKLDGPLSSSTAGRRTGTSTSSVGGIAHHNITAQVKNSTRIGFELEYGVTEGSQHAIVVVVLCEVHTGIIASAGQDIVFQRVILVFHSAVGDSVDDVVDLGGNSNAKEQCGTDLNRTAVVEDTEGVIGIGVQVKGERTSVVCRSGHEDRSDFSIGVNVIVAARVFTEKVNLVAIVS